jgi:hypothetical protein
VSISTYLVYLLLKTRLEKSIGHEYNVKLEEYKNDIEKRNKAEQISELLSEWISLPDEEKRLKIIKSEIKKLKTKKERLLDLRLE